MICSTSAILQYEKRYKPIGSIRPNFDTLLGNQQPTQLKSRDAITMKQFRWFDLLRRCQANSNGSFSFFLKTIAFVGSGFTSMKLSSVGDGVVVVPLKRLFPAAREFAIGKKKHSLACHFRYSLSPTFATQTKFCWVTYIRRKKVFRSSDAT